MIVLVEEDHAVGFSVRVAPRSRRTAIMGIHNGMLKVSVNAAPADGAANAALIKFLAKELRVPKSAVQILNGHTRRTKRLRIVGVSADAIHSLIP